MPGGDCPDHDILIRSDVLSSSEPDLEAHGQKKMKGFRHLLKELDRSLSGRRSGRRRSLGKEIEPFDQGDPSSHNAAGDGAPPEWVLLLIGCLLGLATGICVAAFNGGVSCLKLRIGLAFS